MNESKPIFSNADLKKGIWIYFILLIFEGALRKWFLPGLATPLLVIRDPLALWILVIANGRGLLLSNIYLSSAFTIGAVGIFTAVIFGHGSLPVAIFGARILMLHLPLIFVIGTVFDQEDVLEMGKVTLFISIPIGVLIALQFYSPQSAWVNRGLGGDVEGSGFSGAMGYMRPAGTFSFSTGNTYLYSLISVFVFYYWLNMKNINKIVLIAATAMMLLVIPLSISRSLLFSILVTFVFVLAGSLRSSENLVRMVLAAIGIVLIVVIANQFPFFQTGVEVFSARFNGANESEGGLEGVLVDRYLGGLVNALNFKSGIPFFGYGQGSISNVGSMLLSGRTFGGMAEGEWGRTIAELGPILGLLLVFLRISFSIKVALAGFSRLKRGDLLPWLLLSSCLLIFPQGNWAQPTSLGFSTLVTGLLIASLRERAKEPEPEIETN
ncbi:hypothetical protein ATK78_2152 [Pedobacter metabolipauper]|uniref:O-antigen ligase-like membrane protein n=2 Tax=Pedobacter metabolipauper TaxID=425513 RepID=A0A4R6SXR0_9SPHI|nr:hypothetical protein ATK78_2152 [Pedobacter metabolipauper]